VTTGQTTGDRCHVSTGDVGPLGPLAMTREVELLYRVVGRFGPFTGCHQVRSTSVLNPTGTGSSGAHEALLGRSRRPTPPAEAPDWRSRMAISTVD
jgi:hypothetical protein